MSEAVDSAARPSTRVAVGVEYDGSRFSGWQIQEGARTVQGAVESALSKVANHPVRIHCAGRTDSGVHACKQVIHFDTTAERALHAWVLGGNANLPGDVSLLWAVPVEESFHARFSARWRRYRYVILNRRMRPAIAAPYVSWEYRPLDAAAMADAARHLVGEHDFSSFRAYACQAKHPVRTIHELSIKRDGERIYIDVRANAFLHHMVRNIAGVLMTIGAGERPVSWVLEVLAARDRQCGGVTAPASGLYLVDVGYPEEFALPAFSGTVNPGGPNV